MHRELKPSLINVTVSQLQQLVYNLQAVRLLQSGHTDIKDAECSAQLFKITTTEDTEKIYIMVMKDRRLNMHENTKMTDIHKQN